MPSGVIHWWICSSVKTSLACGVMTWNDPKEICSFEAYFANWIRAERAVGVNNALKTKHFPSARAAWTGLWISVCLLQNLMLHPSNVTFSTWSVSVLVVNRMISCTFILKAEKWGCLLCVDKDLISLIVFVFTPLEYNFSNFDMEIINAPVFTRCWIS